MSISPAGPERRSDEHYEVVSTPRWIPIVFVILFALVGYLGYDGFSSRQALHTANQKVDLLTVQLDKANDRIAGLRGQLDLTSKKVGLSAKEIEQARNMAIAARKQQEQLQAQFGQMQQETASKMGQLSTDIGGAKSDIEAARKDLEATKSKLERTIGDLGVTSGLVAHSKEELEELKRLGERNIYEFSLRKAKGPERVGPIMVQLRSVDRKSYRYSLYVVADDKRIEKKDKTVGEPVQFYVRGVRAPYEIVVFDVGKDRATGYLSTPKETGTPPAGNQ